MRLGFIGLGIMGAPMAGHLRAAGHELFVQTRSAVPPALIASGAQPCATAAGVGRAADIVFLMVPDTPDVERVVKLTRDCSTQVNYWQNYFNSEIDNDIVFSLAIQYFATVAIESIPLHFD